GRPGLFDLCPSSGGQRDELDLAAFGSASPRLLLGHPSASIPNHSSTKRRSSLAFAAASSATSLRSRARLLSFRKTLHTRVDELRPVHLTGKAIKKRRGRRPEGEIAPSVADRPARCGCC